MCEQKNPLLNAYLDGELRAARREELEKHLQACPSCQAELEELRRVSDLLRAAPAPDFTPPERFAAGLLLRLNAQADSFPQPQPEEGESPRRSPPLLWWLAPVGLLGAWVVLRSALTVGGALSLAQGSGLLGEAAAWLPSGGDHSLLFSAARSVFAGQISQAGQSTLGLVDQLYRLAGSLLGQFLWQALVALLFAAWMAAWWLRGRPQPVITRSAPTC